MYGEVFYPNFYLRYQLTMEFIEKFESLSFLGIELPFIMMNSFHFFIKDYVEKKACQISQPKLKIQDLHTLLHRTPQVAAYCPMTTERKAILFTASLSKLAINHFYKEKVVLLVTSKKEEEMMKKLNIPHHFEIVFLKNMLDQTIIPRELEQFFRKKIKVIVQNHLDHDIFGRPDFETWLFYECVKGIRILLCLKKLLFTRNIGVIVEQSQITVPGNVLSLLSMQFHLPFIFIQPRLITDADILPSLATIYCVWGKNYQRWLIKKGIPAEKIFVTGSISIEEKYLSFQASQKSLRQLLNIPSHLPIITLTTQPFMKQVNQEIMSWCNYVCKNLPVCILIQKHPFDSFDYAKELESHLLMESHLDLYEVISQTDLVMTISSTSGIESLLFEKGLLILQPDIPLDYHLHFNDFHAHFVKGAAGAVISGKEELKHVLKQWLENKEYRANIIQQGQQFLTETLQTFPPPSISIKNLVNQLL